MLEEDHGLFYHRGMPVLLLFDGRHGDLRHPGDENRQVSFHPVARVARFLPLPAHSLTATPSSPQGAVP